MFNVDIVILFSHKSSYFILITPIYKLLITILYDRLGDDDRRLPANAGMDEVENIVGGRND